MRQKKVYKNIIEDVLCFPTTSGYGVKPEIWLIYPVHWRNEVFPLKVGKRYKWILG